MLCLVCMASLAKGSLQPYKAVFSLRDLHEKKIESNEYKYILMCAMRLLQEDMLSSDLLNDMDIINHAVSPTWL